MNRHYSSSVFTFKHLIYSFNMICDLMKGCNKVKVLVMLISEFAYFKNSVDPDQLVYSDQDLHYFPFSMLAYGIKMK